MKKICLVFAAACFAVTAHVSADEKIDMYRELSKLKEEYRERIAEIRKAGNEELKNEGMAFLKASAAVMKATEEHPELAEQRKARDEAKAALEEVRKTGDKKAEMAASNAYRDASGSLARAAFKLKEIQDLQAASVAQRKKVEALQYRLVAESGEEGKALMEKIIKLEARSAELDK